MFTKPYKVVVFIAISIALCFAGINWHPDQHAAALYNPKAAGFLQAIYCTVLIFIGGMVFYFFFLSDSDKPKKRIKNKPLAKPINM